MNASASAAMIHDLMMLMPEPAPLAGGNLHGLWLEKFDSLDELDFSGNHSAAAATAERELTAVIRLARTSVLKVLQDLD